MPFNSETAREAGEKSSRKGVPNKLTQIQKERIEKIINMIDEYTSDDIIKLKPIERQKLRAEYSEFVAPKLSRTELKHEGDVEFRHVDYTEKTDD